MKFRIVFKFWAIFVVLSLFIPLPVVAIGSQQNPQSSTLGMEGTVAGNPPTQKATIAIPSNGQTFASTPITVSGLCQTGLLVKIFSNNIFVGSVTCVSGSYSLQVDLFSGANDLVAQVFNNLDQAGPDSSTVTVTFNDAQFAQFGTQVNLTSNYARIGANPGSTLTWPLILSGGTGPYALSVDWGDGSSPELQSVAFPGVINVSHVYSQSGVYTIEAKVTDSNNTSAYLQLVGVGNGKISGAISNGSGTTNSGKTDIIWQPMVAAIPIILIAFWLGRRHELYVIRRSIESSRNQV
ncbi:MAG: hypothetical protein ACREF5_02475 [Candidatus Saccharimonadales bacterium]